jgi:hypothetical protein
MIWFGFLGLFVLTSIFGQSSRQGPAPMFFLVPVGMGIIGYVVMQKLVWDLADEVYDCGDHLLVRNSGREHHIDLSNVINVSHSSMTNPQRVTLTLREPVGERREIVFAPPANLVPFSRNRVVDDLIQRIDALRRRAAP